MHCTRAVLHSPVSVDTDTWTGPVAPPPSSGGEAPGFAEQLRSLDESTQSAPLPSRTSGTRNNQSDSYGNPGLTSSTASRRNFDRSVTQTSEQAPPPVVTPQVLTSGQKTYTVVPGIEDTHSGEQHQRQSSLAP